jgi:hypothetical protein
MAEMPNLTQTSPMDQPPDQDQGELITDINVFSSFFKPGESEAVKSVRRSLLFGGPEGGPEPVADEGFFSFYDTAMAIPRGVAGFASDLVNLGGLVFDYEVEDRFGMDASTTMVGGAVEGITSFLTGFLPVAGIMGKIGRGARFARMASGVAKASDRVTDSARAAYNAGRTAKAVSLAGAARGIRLLPEFARVTAASAFADFVGFDGHEERLSNLLRDYAGLQDPITAYLAADDFDGEVEGRLKNALEGAMLGSLVDGLMIGIRVFRAGKRAKDGGLDPTRAMVEETTRIRSEQINKIRAAIPGTTEEEASAALTLIEATGVQLSDLDIFGGQVAVERFIQTVDGGTGAARGVDADPGADPQLELWRSANEETATSEGPARWGFDAEGKPSRIEPKEGEQGWSRWSDWTDEELDAMEANPETAGQARQIRKLRDAEIRKSQGLEPEPVLFEQEPDLPWGAAEAQQQERAIIQRRRRYAAAVSRMVGDNERPKWPDGPKKGQYMTDDEIRETFGDANLEKFKEAGEKAKEGKLKRPQRRDARGRFVKAGERGDDTANFPDKDLKTPDHEMEVIEGAEQARYEADRAADSAPEISSNTRVGPDGLVYKGARRLGYTEFAEDGRILVGVFKGGDFGTLIHETAHIFRRLLFNKGVHASNRLGIDNADIDLISEWAGATRLENGGWLWTAEAEERFADGFLTYLRTNEMPVGARNQYLWTRITAWLTNLFENVRQSPEIDVHPKISETFNKIMENRLNLLKNRVDKKGNVIRPMPVKQRAARPDDQGEGAQTVLFETDGSSGMISRKVTEPVSVGLGKPSATPINYDRVSSVHDLNVYARNFVRNYMDENTLRSAPQSLEEVAAEARATAKELGEITGTKSHEDFDVKDLGYNAAAIPEAARNLQALRALSANVLGEVMRIAKRGASASREEVYEFLRGQVIADKILRVVKTEQRNVGRMLRAQAIVPDVDDTFSLRRITAGEDIEDIVFDGLGDRSSYGDDYMLVPPPAPTRPVDSPATPTGGKPGPQPGTDTSPTPTTGEVNAPTKPMDIDPRPALEAPPSVMDDVIEKAGGIEKVRRQMQKYAMQNEQGTAAMLRTGGGGPIGKIQNILVEYWMNSILSGPTTALVNLTSTLASTLYHPFERALGAAFRGNIPLLKKNLAIYIHMASQFGPALRLAGEALKRGDGILESGIRARETAAGAAMHQALHSRNISFIKDEGFAANIVNGLGVLVNFPSRGLTTVDELFKQLTYRAHFKSDLIAASQALDLTPVGRAEWVAETLNKTLADGQAYAQNTVFKRAMQKSKELMDSGELSAKDREAWVANYMTENFDENLGVLSNYAITRAQDATFQTPLDTTGARGSVRAISGMIQGIVSRFPTLRFLLPFVRTPTNLLMFAVERSPIVGQMMNAKKAFRELGEQSISEDAAVRADAMGRFAMATAGIGLFVMAAESDMISGGGPTNKAERELKEKTGWRPYSIRIGDNWVSYRRLDPFSTTIGLVADFVEVYKTSGEIDSVREGFDVALKALTATVGSNLANKTYLTGLTNAANALSEPDRMGEAFAEKLAGGFVPNALNQINSMYIEEDPVHREVRGVLEALKARIPGWSETLPVRRNLFGEPVNRGNRAFGGVLEYSEVKDDLIYNELEQIGHGFTRPRNKRGSVDLLDLQTSDGRQVYDRWLELHGQVELGGLTLRERLTRVIRSRNYQNLEQNTTEEFESPRVGAIRKVISRYREAAFQQVLQESPDLREAWTKDRQVRSALRRGESMPAALQNLRRQ